MSFMTINDWRIPVKSCTLQPIEIGSRERAVDGTTSIQRRAVKRSWKVQTALLSWETANAIWQLVQGRGHIFQYDGSTNPQTTSGNSYLASAGGLMPTNTPTFSIDRALAADGANVKHWRGGSTFSFPTKFGLGGLFPSVGTTNLFVTAIRTCSDNTAWSSVDTTVALDTTHKWQGSNSISLAFANVGTPRYAEPTAAVVLTLGQVYVWSCYLKSVAGANVTLRVYNVSATYTDVTVALPANTWVRVFHKFTADMGASTSHFFRIYAVDAGLHTIYVDGMQVEQLNATDYSASYWYDGTRAASYGPKYSANAVNIYDSVTISVWSFGPGYAAAANAYENFCSLTGASTSVSTVDLYTYQNIPKLQIRGSTGVTTTSTSDAALTKAVSGWHHLCATYDYQSGTQKLYVNGTLKDTDTMAVQPKLSEIENVSIGSYSLVNSEHAWGGLNGIMILPFAAPSGLVSAIYGRTTQWPTLPMIEVSGSGIDGTFNCVGNVESGEFRQAFQSTGYASNNIELSFTLEEV